MRQFILSFLVLSAAVLRADFASDCAALTAGVQGQTTSLSGATLGGAAPFGLASFPVVMGTISPLKAIMSAGHYGGTYDASAARAVAYSHTGLFSTTAGSVNTTLFSNAVLWTSRQAAPAGTIVAVVSNTTVGTFLSMAGYTVRSISSSITDANLASAHVLILSGQTDYSSTVMTRIATFTAAGGGLLLAQTPWAASAAVFADGTAMLDPFGIVMTTSYAEDTTWTISASPPAAIQSALPAVDALIADKEGTSVLSDADRVIAANAIYQVVSTRIDIAALKAKLQILSDSSHYGTIAPTLAAPLTASTKPVEKMLVRYQSQFYDSIANADLFVHPCAADFPGLPDAGAIAVSRTVAITGNTFADFYMNSGGDSTRFETGVYAPPGVIVTITIPAGLIAQGLEAHITGNGSEDTTFERSTMTFHPKLWRRVPLTSAVTQTGHVLGGIITILIPPAKTLGNFSVTIDGGIDMPVFTLGETTDAQWKAGIRTLPAPFGILQSNKIRHYLPKWQLATRDNADEVASYWQQVMDIADEYYGYTPYRKRAETCSYSRYVQFGAAYAGYPVESGWATASSDEMLNLSRLTGHWGQYHELGHGYQNNFDSAFVIANGAEVDVNLLPGMIYTMLHDRTAWDKAHSSYNALDRLTTRSTFLALPAASQTWVQAHTSYPVAYDFYFNLAEAFGWQVYKTALTRLMLYLQTPTAVTDAELHALSSADPNFKRNRFYLLFCDAAGRNLDTYFQRYGLGTVGLGTEITDSVKTQIAAKNYPAWLDNTALDSVSTPPTLSVSESAAPGTELYQFIATDADEPGTIWDYQITTGNLNNAFSIDKRTGKLRVQKADADTTASYTLTVSISDSGVPRFTETRSVTINITGTAEAPLVEGRLHTATSAMADGTTLGNVTVTLEPGRTIASYAIVAGNDGHFVIHPTTGILSVSNASTLPNPGVHLLTIRVEDNTGAVGLGKTTVLCNRATGIYDERWTTGRMIGTPTATATVTNLDPSTNAAENYVRRLSGWIVPQKTGPYRFWTSGNQEAITSLSTDEHAANRISISSVGSSTADESYDEQVNQKSNLIHLQAGRPYYVEVIHRDYTGSDFVTVAWEGPNFTRTKILSAFLIPADAITAMPSSTLTTTEQWRITHFAANAGNDLIAGPTADPDHDGIPNLMEEAFALSPLTPGVLSSAITHDLEPISANKYLRLNVIKSPLATGITYAVEVSGDLQTWVTNQTVIETNTATSLVVRDTIPLSTNARRFIRLRMTK